MSALPAAGVSPGPAPVAPWHHCVLTLSAPAFAALFTPEVLRSALARACVHHAEEAPVHLHHFQPQGASLWVGGVRFHLTLHTWPERGLATLDVLGPQEGTAALVETLLLALGMAVVQRSDSARGG